MFALSLSLSL